jgi:hypothetical protein
LESFESEYSDYKVSASNVISDLKQKEEMLEVIFDDFASMKDQLDDVNTIYI